MATAAAPEADTTVVVLVAPIVKSCAWNIPGSVDVRLRALEQDEVESHAARHARWPGEGSSNSCCLSVTAP